MDVYSQLNKVYGIGLNTISKACKQYDYAALPIFLTLLFKFDYAF